jgi:hypothetical protein
MTDARRSTARTSVPRTASIDRGPGRTGVAPPILAREFEDAIIAYLKLDPGSHAEFIRIVDAHVGPSGTTGPESKYKTYSANVHTVRAGLRGDGNAGRTARLYCHSGSRTRLNLSPHLPLTYQNTLDTATADGAAAVWPVHHAKNIQWAFPILSECACTLLMMLAYAQATYGKQAWEGQTVEYAYPKDGKAITATVLRAYETVRLSVDWKDKNYPPHAKMNRPKGKRVQVDENSDSGTPSGDSHDQINVTELFEYAFGHSPQVAPGRNEQSIVTSHPPSPSPSSSPSPVSGSGSGSGVGVNPASDRPPSGGLTPEHAKLLEELCNDAGAGTPSQRDELLIRIQALLQRPVQTRSTAS